MVYVNNYIEQEIKEIEKTDEIFWKQFYEDIIFLEKKDDGILWSKYDYKIQKKAIQKWVEKIRKNDNEFCDFDIINYIKKQQKKLNKKNTQLPQRIL
jgi:hypothetical protein